MEATDSQGRNILCQCLAAISMADGDLDSREIATQLTVIEQITGLIPSADEVVTASIEMGEWDDFIVELKALQDQFSPGFRRQILKACIMIGRADDAMQEAESDRITAIASTLGFTSEELAEQLKIIR